jgi:hypothetical protein
VLTDDDIREQLSIAFIHTVASRAGYAWEPTRIDKDGIDGRVRARDFIDPRATVRSPSIGFQLKATTTITGSPDPIPYPLKQGNYNHLRGDKFAEPRYLALLVLPEDPAEWVKLDADALVLRRCMHWKSLVSAPETKNEVTTTVYIPRANILDMEGMQRLVVAAACQEIIS